MSAVAGGRSFSGFGIRKATLGHVTLNIVSFNQRYGGGSRRSIVRKATRKDGLRVVKECKSLFILCAVIGSVSLGCAAAVVGGGAAGTVLYMKGDLEKTIHAPYDQVYEAGLSGLKDLGLDVAETGKGTEKASIKSRRLDGKPIRINIAPQTKETTRISIRVGTFGDEQSSREILDAIEAHL